MLGVQLVWMGVWDCPWASPLEKQLPPLQQGKDFQ